MKHLIFFLVLIFSDHFVHAKQDQTYEYLLQNYVNICQQSDESKKIEELQILLVESKRYLQKLPEVPYLVWPCVVSAIWMVLAVKQFQNQGFLFYMNSLFAIYHTSWFLCEASRFGHKDEIIYKNAQLESLIAGIEKRLSMKV